MSQSPKAEIPPELQQTAAGGCHLGPWHPLDTQGHPTRGQGRYPGAELSSRAVNPPAGLLLSTAAAAQLSSVTPAAYSQPGFAWAGTHINNVGGIGITVRL